MQATSTTALEPVTSDQSLAWPPEIHETKRTPTPTHSAASDPASDQTEYMDQPQATSRLQGRTL